MYQRDNKDPHKELIEKALSDYADNVNDVSAGYTLLRNTSLLKPIPDNRFVQTILDEFDREEKPVKKNGYLILRFARKGLLSYCEEADVKNKSGIKFLSK